MRNTATLTSLIIATIVFGYFLLVKWNSNQLSLTKTLMNSNIVFSKFEDLDGDGSTDEVYIIDYNNIYSVFGIRCANGFISDIKVEGKLKSRRSVYFHDVDFDGKKEIWSITRYQDTLRLNLADLLSVKETYPIIPVDPNFSLEFQDYFVEIAGYYEDHLFFAINSGYPLEPRAIYSFNRITKKFSRSKDEGSLLLNPFFFDLDNDGVPEIIPRSFAPENIHYDVPYTDSSAWLRVFDVDLNHVFEPIEYKHNTSTIEVFPYVTDTANYLCVSHRYGGQKNVMHSVSLVDQYGEIVLKEESKNRRALFGYKGKLFVSDYNVPAIFEVDKSLRVTKKVVDLEEPFVVRISKNFPLAVNEDLFLSYSNDRVFVLSKDFRSISSYPFPDGIEDVASRDMQTIHVRSGGKEYILKYAKEVKSRWGILIGVVLFQFIVGYFFYRRKEEKVVDEEVDCIIFKTNQQLIKVRPDEIEYLETAKGTKGSGPYTNVKLTTQELPVLIVKNIGSIEKDLPGRFYRVSRKHIVNIKKVIAVNSKSRELTLTTKKGIKILPVSKVRISALQNKIEKISQSLIKKEARFIK